MAEKNYSAMKKEELINLAREMKVWVVASMRKDEIIASIRLAEAAAKGKGAAPKIQKGEAQPPAAKKAPAAKATKAPAKPQVAAKAKTASPKITAEDALATPKAKAKTMEAKPAAEQKPAAAAPKAPAQAPAPVSAAPKTPAKPQAKAVTKAPLATAVKEAPATLAPTASVSAAPAQAASAPAAAARPASKPATGKFDISPDVKKFFAARETSDYGPPPSQGAAGGPALAGRYGETEITAMAKGPGALYVYWEVTPERADEARAAMGRHWSLLRWMVRIYDVTGGSESDTALYYDFPVDSGAGALHATLPRAEREYVAAIGFVDNGGNFMAIAYSNRLGAPGPEIAGITAEGISALMDVGAGRIPGSPMGLQAAGGQWTMLSGAGLSGIGVFGAGLSGAGFAAAKGRRMWLNTELTIYGGVDPVDASVYLGDRELPLAPGGFFTAKFMLRDGVTDLPVKAEWRDGAQMTGGVTVTQATKEIR